MNAGEDEVNHRDISEEIKGLHPDVAIRILALVLNEHEERIRALERQVRVNANRRPDPRDCGWSPPGR